MTCVMCGSIRFPVIRWRCGFVAHEKCHDVLHDLPDPIELYRKNAWLN